MTPTPIPRHHIESLLAPFGSSRTLPAAAYNDEAVLAWEKEHIFSATWVCVGRVEELLGPGQIRGVEVGDESVLLVREPDGRIGAFSNVCRHRGHELAPVGEPMDVRSIRCPYHAWSYRFDGTLRAAPTFSTTPGFDMGEYPLFPIAVSDLGGWLWVDLSGRAPDIDTHFGNLAGIIAPYDTHRLRTAATHSYVVEANWKIVVENYNECYHCSSIHPELCEVTPPDSGVDHQPTGMWLGGTMELKPHAMTMSLDGASGGVKFPGLDDKAARQVWYVTVTPNLLLSLHPDYVMTHRLTPLSAQRTQVECSWLFSPESMALDGFDPSYAVDFWDITNREDWAACEGVMRGVNNRGYRPGPLSSWEGTVYQFLNWVGNLYAGNGMLVPTAPVRDLQS